MSQPLAFKKLIIATHNAGKVKEFAALINHDGLELVAAGALGLPEPDETGTSFAANAKLKALAAASAANLPALADDSGLSVEALSGAPGIFSARWAGPDKNFSAAMQKVESELRAAHINPNGAKAAFIAALCFCMPNGDCVEVEAQSTGTLSFPPRGSNGFGYDPIFIPAGETRSFGEMSAAEKETFSHRAKAFALLKEKVFI